MKKIIDLAQIEARERELVEELAKLRSLKKYATKFGTDYGQQEANGALENAPAIAPADVLDALRHVLTMIREQEFTYGTIDQSLSKLGQTFSRSSIFEGLASLKDKGEILVVHKGAGRRPTQYRITDKFFHENIKA